MIALKEFLTLLRIDECLNLYEPTTNCYCAMSTYKEDINTKYYNYKVTGIGANYDDYGNAILEIEIANI